MHGNVVAFDPTRRRVRASSVAEAIEECAVAAARRRVLDSLKGSGIRNDRISQAQARAERLVNAGVAVSDAVFRAKVWALGATDPDPLPPAA